MEKINNNVESLNIFKNGGGGEEDEDE